MPVSDEMLDEIEWILSASVAAYDSANPVRTGDVHIAFCTCLRCRRDQQEAALARLREERSR